MKMYYTKDSIRKFWRALHSQEETEMTKNETMLNWVGEMRELVQPDEVVWIDGSQEQLESLRIKACNDGDLIKLNQDKLPGCYMHRTALNDVARVEAKTFICSRKQEDAGPTNNWMDKHIKCCTILQEAAIKVKQCM